MVFDWSQASSALSSFGGEAITLEVLRSGLPFFDALQLYGAMDLYIGLRADVEISDRGDRWIIVAHRRLDRLAGRDQLAFSGLWKKKRPARDEYCRRLSQALETGRPVEDDPAFNDLSLGNLDRSLQAGVRGIAAASYETLKSAQTSKNECIAEVPVSQAILAYMGRKRAFRLGDITFLPIFEGSIDLSKVVNPFRASLTVPNVLCAQALAISALLTSLFAEGYQKRLSAVVFETSLPGRRSDNYSGIIAIKSTAFRLVEAPEFADRLYRAFGALVQSGWKRRGRDYEPNEFAAEALSAAQWLMQPAPKHLGAMVTSQEKMHQAGREHFLNTAQDVERIFRMSHPRWQGDPQVVRQFARAVASAIFHARMKNADDRGKAWYDEITMLRSASKPAPFFERALILIEQGHRERNDIGTARRDEAFDPSQLTAMVNDDNFDIFKVLFRMYLVQESGPQTGE